MWNFLEDVEKPSAKRRQSDKEKAEVSKKYEEKRQRKWLGTKWKEGGKREWLEYDGKVMYCAWCRKHDAKSSKSVFIKGTDNLKIEAVKDHEKSEIHRRSTGAENGARNPTETPAARALQTLNRLQRERMKILFRNAHAVGKKARPYSNFEWMCKLYKEKGLDVGDTYTTRQQCANFIHFIAEDQRASLRTNLSDVKYLSLMTDGSTDSAAIEEEILYVRACHEGEVRVHFVGIQPVARADAQSITAAIFQKMDKVIGVGWKEKLVAVGTDGASVNTGPKTGVVQRLREACNRPSIIGLHCMAHRLELSFKDAINGNPCHRNIDTILSGLYAFYHQSPLRRSDLKKVYAEHKTAALMPKRMGGTRWVQHLYRALDNFLTGCIIKHLDKMKVDTTGECKGADKAKAGGYANYASSLSNIKYACFLHDVLDHLTKLSCTIQKDGVSAAQVYSKIKSTMAVLEEYKTRDGPSLKKVQQLKEDDTGGEDEENTEGQNGEEEDIMEERGEENDTGGEEGENTEDQNGKEEDREEERAEEEDTGGEDNVILYLELDEDEQSDDMMEKERGHGGKEDDTTAREESKAQRSGEEEDMEEPDDAVEDGDFEKDEFKFQDRSLTGSDEAFNRGRLSLLNDLIVSIQSRFEGNNMRLLNATKIVDFSYWPEKEDMSTFGNEEVQILADHFEQPLAAAGLDSDTTADEWVEVKSNIYEDTDWKLIIKRGSWLQIKRRNPNCNNILGLIDIVLTIPASTAMCERGFRAMKEVKTDTRSSLSGPSLDSLMVLKMESVSINDFNPIPAINLWLQGAERRPGQEDVLDSDSD